MKTESFGTDREAFLEALHGKRKKTGRTTRPDIPSAARSAPTGLGTILLAGWNWEFRVGAGYRAYRGGVDTGWHPTEKEACLAAKELGK